MQFVTVLLAAALGALVGGCVTAIDPHKLAAGDVQQFGLVDVQVNVAPKARVSWPEEEAAAMREKYGASPSNPGPEDQALMQSRARKALAERIRATMMSDVGGGLSGARKVRAIVTVKQLTIPTLGEQMLINNRAIFDAEIVLVDARSNAQVVAYPGRRIVAPMVGGLAATDPTRVLVSGYTDTFKKWLMRT